MLRAQMRDATELGLAAKSYIGNIDLDTEHDNTDIVLDKGDLVPDQVMVGLISSELKKLGDNAWLLDGFPRYGIVHEIFFKFIMLSGLWLRLKHCNKRLQSMLW